MDNVIDLQQMRGRKLPMTLRQALAIALLALEHVAICDDEDESCEQARRLIAARLREQRRKRAA